MIELFFEAAEELAGIKIDRRRRDIGFEILYAKRHRDDVGLFEPPLGMLDDFLQERVCDLPERELEATSPVPERSEAERYFTDRLAGTKHACHDPCIKTVDAALPRPRGRRCRARLHELWGQRHHTGRRLPQAQPKDLGHHRVCKKRIHRMGEQVAREARERKPLPELADGAQETGNPRRR